MSNPLKKLRRNSPLRTVAVKTRELATQLHEGYSISAGLDHRTPDDCDSRLLFKHWHDVATIAHHLARLANDAKRVRPQAKEIRAAVEVERKRLAPLFEILDRCHVDGKPAGLGIDPEYPADQVLIRNALAASLGDKS